MVGLILDRTATATKKTGGSRAAAVVPGWVGLVMKLAAVSCFKKARIAVARKLAVVLHAMWKTDTPFRWTQSEHDQG